MTPSKGSITKKFTPNKHHAHPFMSVSSLGNSCGLGSGKKRAPPRPQSVQKEMDPILN